MPVLQTAKTESDIRTLALLTGIGFADVSMLVALGHGIGAQNIVAPVWNTPFMLRGARQQPMDNPTPAVPARVAQLAEAFSHAEPMRRRSLTKRRYSTL